MTIAFFPGKFQPPHIGHIKTISKLREQFSKVIIGITEDGPTLVPRGTICDDFNLIFGDYVECVLMAGVLIDYKNTDGLPVFDVLVTGNDKVVKWAHSFGIKTQKISRSEGLFCSGTEIRKMKGMI